MAYCPPLGRLLLSDRPSLGAQNKSSESGSRPSSAYKHHQPTGSIHKQQQRKTGEESDLAFQREYWEPCNSTFREYYSWGCTGN